LLEIGKGSTSRGDGPNGSGFGNAGDPMFTLRAGAQHGIAATVGAAPPSRRNGGSWPTDGALIAPPLTSNYFGDHESREGLLVPDRAVAFTVHGSREGTQAVATQTDTAGTVRKGTAAAIQNSSNTLVAFGISSDAVDRSGEGDRSAGQRAGLGILREQSPSLRARSNNSVALAFGGNNTAGPVDVATAVNAHGGPHGRLDFESETFVTHSLRAEGFDASEDGTGRGTPLIFQGKASRHQSMNCGALSPSLDRAKAGGIAVALHENQRAEMTTNDTAGSLKSGGGKPGQGYPAAFIGPAVRRLTPRECERLQGFPDDYTLVRYNGKPMADGPRYRMLGNSMAVPVVRWIGDRLRRLEFGAGVSEAAERRG
jgi:DNA (cytosine-5)-methyltransferase 1